MDFSLGVNEVITSATLTDQVRHLAYGPPMSQFRVLFTAMSVRLNIAKVGC